MVDRYLVFGKIRDFFIPGLFCFMVVKASRHKQNYKNIFTL